MKNQNELMIQMAVDTWNSTVKRTNDLFNALSDEQFHNEVSPKRNTGIYLLGHLVAVHDRMLPLLDLEESLYPELGDVFISKPDKAVSHSHTVSELKTKWKEVNDKLSAHFKILKPEDWMLKHSAVSAEDFAKEPHRNRLNILLSRTNHLSYHFGQVAFLK